EPDRQLRRARETVLPRRCGAGRHDWRELRHVPSGRVEYASRDLSEIPGPATARGAAARHDRLVHREPAQGQGARSQRYPAARARSLYPRAAQRRRARLRQTLRIDLKKRKKSAVLTEAEARQQVLDAAAREVLNEMRRRYGIPG